jgi:shikimate kinase
MKSEKEIRKRLNKKIADFFNGKVKYQERAKEESAIKELVWVLEEMIFIENGGAKLVGKKD